MNNKELAQKLHRLNKLQTLIETKVRDIYLEHGELTAECAQAIMEKKGSAYADGFLKVPITIKLRGEGGGEWELVPNYMKDGHLKNVIWKNAGVHAFTINHLPF